jgi:(2R)-sulfolactate sulfo-lyase subunit alpha
MSHQFLIHDKKDNVGVAICDIKTGQKVIGVFLDDKKTIELEAKNDILLGHKISLYSVKKGEQIIKYGVPIGKTTESINLGEHVHIHNLKSERWAQ